MLGKAPSYLPKKDLRLYRIFCSCFYILFVLTLIYGVLTFLFPYQRYSFDFNNPDATKNNLFEPHLADFSSLTDGKIPASANLSFYANNPQVIEAGDITIIPRASFTSSHLEGAMVKIRRGFAATFFPAGEALDVPTVRIVEYQGNFYEQKDAVLFPYVSEAAAKSYLPEEYITSLSKETFDILVKSEDIIGFRPGTLLAYADGVFFVTEEGTIRPFGSAEVLLRSGYSFNHIIQASGEDVGIYKRGKIILPGELHLGGTLFSDRDTQRTFLFQGKKLHPLTEKYANFLSSKNDIISFSAASTKEETSCFLIKQFLRDTYTCHFTTLSLRGIGNDYQITVLNPHQPTNVQLLQVGLQSSRQKENARATFRSLTSRVLERIGLY